MSKIILLLLVSVTVTLAAPERKLVDIPPEIAQLMINSVKECSRKSNVDDLLALGREGKWKEEEAFKAMIRCAFQVSGYTTKAGKLNLEKAFAVFPDHEDVKKVIQDCSDDTSDMFYFYKCFQKKTPLLINLH